MLFIIDCMYGDIHDYIYQLKNYGLDFVADSAYIRLDSLHELEKLRDSLGYDLVIGRNRELIPHITIWDD